MQDGSMVKMTATRTDDDLGVTAGTHTVEEGRAGDGCWGMRAHVHTFSLKVNMSKYVSVMKHVKK